MNTETHSRRRLLVNDARVTAFVARSVGSTDCQAHSSIGLEQDGKVVAGVVFDNYTGYNIFMHFSRAPGHVVGQKFLRIIFGYAFLSLKVKRITGACSAGNAKVRQFAEHLGFQIETRLKGAYADGDMLFYSMWPGSCRWIQPRPAFKAKASRAPVTTMNRKGLVTSAATGEH